ncbi:phosphoribosyltransferase family protein [Mesonia ostreae]|uniref:Phosphoribosyltransferase family protein n=1 Tax=Mesonia ostreae TaxID=861110 RepID=A0ABU2KK59_9FLAO|nr:phosphoribosyltransferase family protein [Mesonia ostreae]MDT0295096.1 phosphoribosyltransferase family protein [Mesonia ostreae]
MKKETTLILNHIEIEHKIRRIAFQIYENNIEEKEIVLAGIARSGYIFAEKLKECLENISPIQIILCEVKVNKKNPLDRVETSLEKEQYSNKSIIIVDDVLNSGATLIYGIKHFLNVPVKKLQTAVLVDRSHKKYPIKADFKGISLSTSLSERVKVSLAKEYKAELL